MTIRRLIRLLISAIRWPKYWLHHSHVPFTTEIRDGVNLTSCKLGKYSYIARNTDVNCAQIGNYVSIASDVHIGGMEHSLEDASTSAWLSDKGYCDKITTIGHDVWIGAGSIIKQGVTIGNGAVVGANSFVNKDVPSYAIVVGSPARIIKYRFDENNQSVIQNTLYWDFPPEKARRILQTIKLN